MADSVFDMAFNGLMSTPAGQKLRQVMDVISAVQRNIFALRTSEDSAALKLLRIGTVFQVFLIDTLAGGKKPSELSPDDWKNIAEKISEYAILPDGQGYTEFVFALYADYIELSVQCLCKRIPESKREAMESSLDSIQDLANAIRYNTHLLHKSTRQAITETEVAYVEECLWLSLEAMIKLLSASLAEVTGGEFTQLAQAVSQLAFEYGRYTLYAKERALLESYIQNQHILDEQLQWEYDTYISAVRENAGRFQSLVDNAFSADLHNSLLQTAALARAAGVNEKELLTSMENVDSFFLD